LCILNSTIAKLNSDSTSIDTNALVSDAIISMKNSNSLVSDNMSSMKNSRPSPSCPVGQKYTQSTTGTWSCR
jgi:hypothetical protein